MVGGPSKFLVGRHPYAAAGAQGCASYLKYETDPMVGDRRQILRQTTETAIYTYHLPKDGIALW